MDRHLFDRALLVEAPRRRARFVGHAFGANDPGKPAPCQLIGPGNRYDNAAGEFDSTAGKLNGAAGKRNARTGQFVGAGAAIQHWYG